MSTASMTLYRFSLTPGVKDADFLQASEKFQSFLNAQPGFQYRSLAKSEDGSWLETSYWENKGLLAKANEAFDKDENCKALLNLIDKDSVTVQRADVLYCMPAAQ